jgi:hypothetical protein
MICDCRDVMFRHSLPMTKAFYVKIFAIMDAAKRKKQSQKATGLKLSKKWETMGQITPMTTIVDQELLSDIPSSVSPQRKAHNAWCKHDEKLLYDAWHADADVMGLHSTWGRYIRILEKIQDQLVNKDRTNSQLRDKWINMEKTRSRKRKRDVDSGVDSLDRHH